MTGISTPPNHQVHMILRRLLLRLAQAWISFGLYLFSSTYLFYQILLNSNKKSKKEGFFAKFFKYFSLYFYNLYQLELIFRQLSLTIYLYIKYLYILFFVSTLKYLILFFIIKVLYFINNYLSFTFICFFYILFYILSYFFLLYL